MTEASHQMTSNPLPKNGPHKPGTVGTPQGSVQARDIPFRELPQGISKEREHPIPRFSAAPCSMLCEATLFTDVSILLLARQLCSFLRISRNVYDIQCCLLMAGVRPGPYVTLRLPRRS
jgi:hypothetical protein